jgi:hypothetical protein
MHCANTAQYMTIGSTVNGSATCWAMEAPASEGGLRGRELNLGGEAARAYCEQVTSSALTGRSRRIGTWAGHSAPSWT